MKLAAIFVVTAQAFSVNNAEDTFIGCFRAFEKDLKKCTKDMDKDPVCDENSPDFNFPECNNKFMTCVLRSIGTWRDCMKGLGQD